MLAELQSQLANKRVLILGIGNHLRGDDAVGPLLIDSLQGKVNVPMIDAGDVPENYLGPIEESRAELVLVIDAVNMDTNPGDTALLDIEQVQGKFISTHTTNLGLLFKAIPPESRPQVIVLGVQPESMEFSQRLSESVSRTLDAVAIMVTSCFDRRHERF